MVLQRKCELKRKLMQGGYKAERAIQYRKWW